VYLTSNPSCKSSFWYSANAVISTFGSSLSYIDSKGSACASSPQILQDILVPSEKEFTIMSNKSCSNGDCGFVRPGSVAYR